MTTEPSGAFRIMAIKLIEQASAIIRAASESMLALFALMIWVLAAIVVICFLRAPLRTRVGAFLLTVFGGAALGSALFLKDQGFRTVVAPCQPDLRSTEGGSPATINFGNESSQNVLLYWVDYGGCEVLYWTLPPAQSHRFETFAAHRWLIKDERGNLVKAVVVTRVSENVRIGGN